MFPQRLVVEWFNSHLQIDLFRWGVATGEPGSFFVVKATAVDVRLLCLSRGRLEAPFGLCGHDTRFSSLAQHVHDTSSDR